MDITRGEIVESDLDALIIRLHERRVAEGNLRTERAVSTQDIYLGDSARPELDALAEPPGADA